MTGAHVHTGDGLARTRNTPGIDFAQVFEASPTPFLLLQADAPNFTIAAVNESYLRATRTERSQLVGKHLFEAFPDNPRDRSASGVKDLKASLERVLSGRATDAMGVQKYDIPLRERTGEFETKYWSPLNAPVMSADNRITHILHRVEDVTEFVQQQRSLADAEQASRDSDVAINRMAAEALRSGQELKDANRNLKEALERVAEINAQLESAGRLQSDQLDVAISAAGLGLWMLDLKTNTLTSSENMRRAYGWQSSELFTFEDMRARVHPQDLVRRDAIVAEAIENHQDFEVDYRIAWPDGEIRWIQMRGRAEYDADGVATTTLGVKIDITQRKRAEERQRVLIAELNHRVKNTLASVQSIALQTSLATRDPAEFVAAFDGRVRALVGAHDLLTANAWQAASLWDVVSRTLAPYLMRDGADERVDFSGPLMLFHPEAAVTLHMALHELATNAAKYGALSAPAGTVSVTWTVDRASDPAVVEIVWQERGGPPVVAPTRRGFGANLLERGLARELGGSVEMKFEPEGLVCVMRFAMSDKLGPG